MSKSSKRGTAGLLSEGVGGKVRNEVLFDSDGAHTGSCSTVRNGKGFMEIEMANISIEVPGRRVSDLSIHIGTVHVNLSSIFMYGLDHLVNRALVLTCS